MGTRAGGRGERLRVAVLMGGPSSEHEVSLEGGRNVALALDPQLFDVRPVVIGRDGQWRLPPRALRLRDGDGRPLFDPHAVESWKVAGGPLQALTALTEWPADVVFPVLHGRFGEDGTLQACLAAARLPFVGSGSLASGLANDKVRTKEILAFHGLPTPPFEVLEVHGLRRGRASLAEGIVARHGTPVVLKDPCGGSSLEVRIADDAGEVARALGELSPPATRILVERYVRGRELTAGVLEDRERRKATALPVVEIRPRKGRCFDYHEKYSPEGAEEICPAPIPGEVETEARRLALAVHQTLGLRGLSRTDLLLDAEGRLHILEVNTLPGMTERGLVPRAARAIGLDFPKLVESLVRTASRD